MIRKGQNNNIFILTSVKMLVPKDKSPQILFEYLSKSVDNSGYS